MLEGFDLDLSYITDRIIAMGFPSEGREGVYRNPMSEVVAFLERYHRDHYMVYNLCSERDYSPLHFRNRVRRFPFDDHNACPLTLIRLFAESVHDWLSQNQENVVVIHCKAGKGRTGLMISAFLAHDHLWKVSREEESDLQKFAIETVHHSKESGGGFDQESDVQHLPGSNPLSPLLSFTPQVHDVSPIPALSEPYRQPQPNELLSPTDQQILQTTVVESDYAMKMFANKRTINHKGITIPSQKRYVKYYTAWLRRGSITMRTLRLCRVRMLPVPKVERSGCQPCFRVLNQFGEVLFNSKILGPPQRFHRSVYCVDFAHLDVQDVRVFGDIKFEFYHESQTALGKRERLFECWINTAFIPENTNAIVLMKAELDRACKVDKKHKIFDADFRLELYFSPISNTTGNKQNESTSMSNQLAMMANWARAQTQPTSQSVERTAHVLNAHFDPKSGQHIDLYQLEVLMGEDLFGRSFVQPTGRMRTSDPGSWRITLPYSPSAAGGLVEPEIIPLPPVTPPSPPSPPTFTPSLPPVASISPASSPHEQSAFVSQTITKPKINRARLSLCVTFDHIMKWPAGRVAFREHLQREYNSENIDFWEEVNEYHTLFPPNVRSTEKDISEPIHAIINPTIRRAIISKAQCIVDLYLTPHSAKEINLPSHTHNQILSAVASLHLMESSDGGILRLNSRTDIKDGGRADTSSASLPTVWVPPIHLFDIAQNEVILLMRNDSFPRFIKTNEFEQLALIFLSTKCQ